MFLAHRYSSDAPQARGDQRKGACTAVYIIGSRPTANGTYNGTVQCRDIGVHRSAVVRLLYRFGHLGIIRLRSRRKNLKRDQLPSFLLSCSLSFSLAFDVSHSLRGRDNPLLRAIVFAPTPVEVGPPPRGVRYSLVTKIGFVPTPVKFEKRASGRVGPFVLRCRVCVYFRAHPPP